MDWEKVQRTLKKRQYDKFGDVVEDLRLIFANALKYNGRHKGTDTVSGRAYEAANYMSGKLEAAINRFLLSVSDRIERERIDHNNAEREIEAAERAEEAAIRAQWKKEPDGAEPAAVLTGLMTSRPDVSQKIRIRRAVQRDATDFEIPFFDEEGDGSRHERSYFEVVKFQKAMFEKQREELSKMRQCTAAIGSLVYSRLLQRSLAVDWEETELKKMAASNPVVPVAQDAPESSPKHDKASSQNQASNVLGELEREGRGPLQIKMAKPKTKGTKRKLPALSFE